MVIQRMIEDDLGQVVAIEQSIFSEPWSEQDFLQSLQNDNNLYLVAKQGEELLGYCGYWGVAGDGYIYNVAVKQEHRRQQVGFRMLKELIEQGKAAGISAFSLEVRISNHAAISLYERLGFTSAGIRKNFYSKPNEDAVIMWLQMIQ